MIRFSPTVPVQWRACISQNFRIFPDFVGSEALHGRLVEACSRKLSRLHRGPYLFNHYDGVIQGYKEGSVASWMTATPMTSETDYPDNCLRRFLEQTRIFLDSQVQTPQTWMAPHLLDLCDPLDGDSRIDAHVDNLGASGDMIAGVCLESDAVMILRNVNDPSMMVRALLPRNCLYFQRMSVRYEWTHEIPPASSPEHVFDGRKIGRKRRIAILLRNAPSSSTSL